MYFNNLLPFMVGQSLDSFALQGCDASALSGGHPSAVPTGGTLKRVFVSMGE
jgi:hypothetical protein